MRLAVLSDIHGNLAALEAATNDLTRQRPDQVIVCGDVVNGAADSLACWERVKALGYPAVRGNHEGYVAGYGGADAPAVWATPQYAPVAWAAAQLGAARFELGRLPTQLTLPGVPELLFLHASLRSNRDNVSAYTPEAILCEMFPELRASVVVRGHDHVAATRTWDDRLLVTAGSVGVPLSGVTEAQYLLLERRRSGWQPRFCSVPYDVEGTLARFHSSGYLETAGPIARLFYREVATATPQLTPFLRSYARWSEAGKLGLEASVQRFMTFGAT